LYNIAKFGKPEFSRLVVNQPIAVRFTLCDVLRRQSPKRKLELQAN